MSVNEEEDREIGPIWSGVSNTDEDMENKVVHRELDLSVAVAEEEDFGGDRVKLYKLNQHGQWDDMVCDDIYIYHIKDEICI